METPLICPLCNSLLRVEERGDLVTSHCTACGWQEQVTVARAFPEIPRSVPAVVEVKAPHAMSPEALAELKALSAEVRAVPLRQLEERLESTRGVSLGLQAEYRAKELKLMLEGLGFEVRCAVQGDAA